MHKQIEKPKENNSRGGANAVAQKKSSVKQGFGFVDHRPEAIAQRKLIEMVNHSVSERQQPIQKKENNTGLPDTLKSGIENLSGHSMDDVKVHYNSGKPTQLNAHAYAQGTDIHLASGQEKHLPHEAWHVVQQKQGRVKATKQLRGKVNINDDSALEKEADIMGAKAAQLKIITGQSPMVSSSSSVVFQLAGKDAFRFAKSRGMGSEDLFLTSTGKSKSTLTKLEVMELLNNDEISIELREGLREHWNLGLGGGHRIEASATKYHAKLLEAQKAHMAKYKGAAKLGNVNEYDSEDEDSSIGLVEEIKAMFAETHKVTVVTQDGDKSVAYVVSPATGVQILRKIRKLKLFKEFRGIHLIFPMGKFYQLYTAPRGNDFAYAPVLEKSKGVFQRGGNIDSWHAIAVELTNELKKIKDNTFKAQIQRIIESFRGGHGPLTHGESHAVGAIMCDYAAGSRGTMHYLEILARSVGFGAIGDHMTAWAGARPGYSPAAVGGRPLVGAKELMGKPEGAMEEEGPVVDEATVHGRRYRVHVAGVREAGECFWDTLRHYGISNANIITAAGQAGLAVDHHVNVDQMAGFFARLATVTGTTYRVNLDIINMMNLQPISSHRIVNGVTVINIGLFANPQDGLGHFVPST
jgi:hypothetical protein